MYEPANDSSKTLMVKWRKILLIPLATLILVLLAIDFSTFFFTSKLVLVSHRNINILLSIIFSIMGLLSIILKDKLTKNYRTAFLACLLISVNFLNLALKYTLLRNMVFLLAIVMVVYFKKGNK
jgi:hypothetical protein